ncbi:hypothetical protein C0Q70_07000 [Pomacea canaliculata]|uniref:MAGUK p55 subfamily member 6 n=2 Tax=Pomacea canaliculata TaxID=400727 RepID=A0A2T7PDT7_POMCA|nr:hypothetical protein C0Q70_07000 [Pomacea canaliculata]
MYDDLTMDELPDPQEEDTKDLYRGVLDAVSARAASNSKADELRKILENPHFQALMKSHDDVAQENYGIVDPKSLTLPAPPPPVFGAAAEEYRFVTIRKQGKEPLGITVNLDENNDLTIARILQGSLADKQGLLRTGDKVREVNGTEVFTPEDMMILLKEASASVTMKVVPSYNSSAPTDEFFVRSNFNYDPMNDRLIPCKKAGLPFRQGDILQIVSTTDENWWQARSLAVSDGLVGLIPSSTLQEKRSAFVQPGLTNTKTDLLCGLKVKRKKHIKYNSQDTTVFDNCDIRVYEEVTLANYHTRVLALVGSKGVGKRSLINELVKNNPTRFQAPTPYTSRPMGDNDVDGRGYFFVPRELMEREIRESKYLDYGEFDGELYGIKFSTIREIIKRGRVCVMGVSPTALKVIKSPDFQPFIVFIAASSVEAQKVMYEKHKEMMEEALEGRRRKSTRPTINELFQEELFIATLKESRQIEKVYRPYFDDSIVNDDFDTTYKFLLTTMDNLHQGAKWIPVEWKE